MSVLGTLLDRQTGLPAGGATATPKRTKLGQMLDQQRPAWQVPAREQPAFRPLDFGRAQAADRWGQILRAAEGPSRMAETAERWLVPEPAPGMQAPMVSATPIPIITPAQPKRPSELPRIIESLSIPEIAKTAKEMVVPTMPYTQRESDLWAKQIGDQLSWWKTYVASLGGRLGPKGLRDELVKEAETFQGFGPALMPAAGEAGSTALEWGWLYPKLFAAAGLTGEAIASIPKVQEGIKALQSIGGIRKFAQAHPVVYSSAVKALSAATKGMVAGTTLGLTESLGKDMEAGEVLKHATAKGGILAGVAATFSLASDIDTTVYISRLRKELTAITGRRYDSMMANLLKQPPSAQASSSIKGAESLRRIELDQIDNIVAAAEAQLRGIKTDLYRAGQEGFESPQAAAQRIAKYGLEIGKAYPKGPAGLRHELVERKPFIQMPTTRAGEIKETVVETVKRIAKPTVSPKVAERPPAQPVMPVPQAAKPPEVTLPPVPTPKITSAKRQAAIEFVKKTIAEPQYAGLPQEQRIATGLKMLADQGITAKPEEIAPAPAVPAPKTEQARPAATGLTLESQAKNATTDDLRNMQTFLEGEKQKHTLSKDDTARLRAIKNELLLRHRKESQWAEMSDDEWLAKTRFYRSGGTKNAELPDGRRIILSNEATETNFRERSKEFILSRKPSKPGPPVPEAAEEPSKKRQAKQAELLAEHDRLSNQAFQEIAKFKPVGKASDMAVLFGAKPPKGQEAVEIMGTVYAFKKTSIPSPADVERIEAMYKKAEELGRESYRYAFSVVEPGRTTGNRLMVEKGRWLESQGLLDKSEIDYLNKLDKYFREHPEQQYGIVTESGDIITPEATKAAPAAEKVGHPKGNWRQAFDETDDISRKADILRAIADVSRSLPELQDILDRVSGLPDEANIRWAVERNPTFKQAAAAKAAPKAEQAPVVQKPIGSFAERVKDSFGNWTTRTVQVLSVSEPENVQGKLTGANWIVHYETPSTLGPTGKQTRTQEFWTKKDAQKWIDQFKPTPAAEKVAKESPVITQWRHFKEKYPDSILLVRVGDFYEMFGQDADIAAKVLGLTKTTRGDLAMAGVPYHAVDPSLKKLIQAGHKVAVAEQTVPTKKGETKRDVVRVVTPAPGTQEAAIAVPKKPTYTERDLLTGEVIRKAEITEEGLKPLPTEKPKAEVGTEFEYHGRRYAIRKLPDDASGTLHLDDLSWSAAKRPIGRVIHAGEKDRIEKATGLKIWPEEGAIVTKRSLSDEIQAYLSSGKQLDNKTFFAMADKFYGGTRAEGKYQTSDAYDELELGINKYIQQWAGLSPTPAYGEAVEIAKWIEAELLEKLPTQTTRTGEKDAFQQFSTPPHYAYAVAWAANIGPQDIVLEPSAGTGSLLVHAQAAKPAKIYANELSERRAGLLKTLKPDKVFMEDAEQIHNILPEENRPTVILMNPPFSMAPTRMGAKKIYGTDLRHVEAALGYLQEGGRLVAILGRPRVEGTESATFNQWIDKVGKKYRIRANVHVGRNVYKKYGTSFPTRLLIIDKAAPTGEKIIGGPVDTIPDLMYNISEVRDDRIKAKPEPMGKAGEKPAEPTGPEARPGKPLQPATSGLAAAITRPERPVGEVPERISGPRETHVPLETEQGPERPAEGLRPRPAREEGPKPVRAAAAGEPGRQPESVLKPTSVQQQRKKGALSENIFESYQPSKFHLAGAHEHPAALVESTAMAAVSAPDIDYELSLPKSIVTEGRLSDIQLEVIAYAGQAHQQMLPKDAKGVQYRKGFFIGDGTGVGKGREISGIILDNWNKGRKKALWVSVSKDLLHDARRDWGKKGIGQNADKIFPYKTGMVPTTETGIMYVTYDTLKWTNKKKAIGEGELAMVPARANIDNIVEWLGKDFDGVIAFDEAHKMGNAMALITERGKKQPSKRALIGMELQKRLPNARVVYVSATGATEIENLTYAQRLGLWGNETPFANPTDFIGEMASGGVANMELIARDLKALGLYQARSIAYNDGTEQGTVRFDTLEHKLSQDQVIIYNKLAEAWQIVLQNFYAALEVTGGAKSGTAKGAAYSAFYGTQQRFFNQVLTAMQVPSAISHIQQKLNEGNSIVIQLTNTMEAAQERALADMDKDQDLEDFDITPRDALIQLVEHCFPTTQYETYIDENGNERSRPVLDSHGNPVENREAVQMRAKLIDEIGSIRVPESPLDMIINHFGPDKVAEVTGRKRRVVTRRQADGSEKKVMEKRSHVRNLADVSSFMNGGKRVLIFSEAGGTGVSYHADKTAKNQQKRIHYVLQPGWRADTCLQGMGRTHRSNQAFAPEYWLVRTNLNAQKRFTSSVARRLDQMGALTRGERKAGSAGLFTAADNLESQEAKDALRVFFRDLVNGDIEGLDTKTFEKQTGLKLTDKQGKLLMDKLPNIRQFLNRLLAMTIANQNEVFAAFEQRLVDRVHQAIVAGTLDQGVEVYRADKVEKISDTVVYTHPQTGSQTRYVKLRAYTRNKPVSWEQIQQRKVQKYVRSKKAKHLYAVVEAHAKTEAETGKIIDQYRLISPTGLQRFIQRAHIDWDYGKNWETIERAEAQTAWAEAIEKVPEFHTEDVHFLTGTILPIWDKIRGTARIYRVLTTDGEEMIGRTMHANYVSTTLTALGADVEKPQIAPVQALKQLVNADIQLELANQWTLKYASVGGEARIELRGPNFQNNTELDAMGIFREKIRYETRYFVPTKDAESLQKLLKRWPVVEIRELRSSEETGKQISGFEADPTVEGEATGEPGFAGVAGRPGGKVAQPWLTLDKTQSPDKDIEDFFGRTKRPPYSRKASSLLAKLNIGLRERFVFAHHIPRSPKTAIFIDLIRTMPEERRAARQVAIKHIVDVLDGDGTVQALDSAGLDLLRRKVFTQDILHEAKIDRSVSGNLNIEQLEAEDARLDALIAKVPSVKKAFEARQKLWNDVTQDLVKRGVLDEESAKNPYYVRHFVLDLAQKNRPTGFLRKRLSAPYRPYSKHRKGSKRDISTDYLEVETRALADIYADNVIEDTANKICELSEKQFGGRKKYTRMAKEENFEKLVGGPEVVDRIESLRSKLKDTAKSKDSDTKKRRKTWIEELTKLDPTYPFRQRIAMHMAKFKKMKYEEAVEFEIEEDTALFKELARAAREQAKEPEGLAARGVFKAMAERERLIKSSLGKEYLTPEKAAQRDGFVEYHYKRPNLFFRAQTITEAQVAAFVENNAEQAGAMLNIPIERMHEALVMGRRKGWLVPEWLAMQLDDLPVNKRSGYIVRSFTKPFIQFWKRWILRVNPFRYNARNAIGDTERFVTSGQEDAIKDIPAALRLLITKEPHDVYNLMRRHGVIGSTLWHEMNDVSRMKEFERFKDFSRPKTFKLAVRKALGLPLRTVSTIGSYEQNLTQLREDILRAAVFMSNYRKLQEGKPVSHWAGKLADIQEIAKVDKARAAAKISREALGDYGEFTPFENDVLRQGLVPFYSWLKINTKFWPRVLVSAAKQRTLGRSLGAAAPRAVLNIARWLVRALWLYGVLYLWNHRDDEAKDKEASLPFWLRAMPHANIGNCTLWGQTALSDFVEWVDMESLASIQWRLDAGFLSRKQAALEATRIIAQAPVNKVYQALSPYLKAPVTAITGMETWPTVFEPHFVASPASRKALERAILNILGSDAKRFYLSQTGDEKFEDTLYAYFAGWWCRPTDPDTLVRQVQETEKWSSLKHQSKVTGRRPGQAKKGKEKEWQEAKIRRSATTGS